MDFAGFDWYYGVSMESTGLYWVLLCFTGLYGFLLELYWVLLSFTGFSGGFVEALVGFTVFYWVLRGFTGFYWVFVGLNGFYWVLLGFTRLN